MVSNGGRDKWVIQQWSHTSGFQELPFIGMFPLIISLHKEANRVENFTPFNCSGKYPTSLIQVEEGSSSSPPKALRIYSPSQLPGTFPVLVFLHASCLENSYYSNVLQFVATHGYIVVAPQLYQCEVFGIPISGPDEVQYATDVVNWLANNLQSVLPGTSKADLDKLTLGGHGRGGKTSFAMAITHAQIGLQVSVAAVLAVDPVAGLGKDHEDEPAILTYVPGSFNLDIPSTIIGTGLGNQTICAWVCPACAPNDVNHEEFYKESTPPTSHIVIKDYGHVDLLDDDLDGTMGFIAQHKCVNGDSNKTPVRTTIAGLVTAFLNAYFTSFDGDYMTILHNPGVTPVTIDTPEFVLDEITYAQF
ncbi:chlorophyllase 1 [Euphorbia peplus]|nr:chlorophyllase 1 [Euphorbia peplus]